MEQTHLHRFLMNIHLSDRDIAQMPESLRNEFLDWLPESLKTKNLRLDPVPVPQHDETVIPNHESQIPEENSDNTHVRLTQLFDAGITKRGMPVRVKLKRKVAKKLSREYVNNLEISATGTIVYNEQEHDKPSPLAAKINGSAANGWEYVEVKKNDQWVCLDELRQIWRKTND
jgi:hypothetical protein